MDHRGGDWTVTTTAGTDRSDDVHALAEDLARLERATNTDPVGCLAQGAELLARADALGDVHARMQALYFTGFAHHLLSQDPQALASMEEARALAELLEDDHWFARVLGGLGAVHSGFGDQVTAIELLERSLEMRRRLGDTYGIAAALNNLGVTFEEMGLFPERAHELLTEAYSLFEQMGEEQGCCASLTHLAALSTTRAENLCATDEEAASDAAEVAFRRAEQAVEHARALPDNHRLLGETLITLARALLAAKRVDEAGRALDEAEGLLTQGETTHFRLRLTATRGRWHRHRGDLTSAIREIERGLRDSSARARAYARATLLDELVRIHEERGAYKDALAAHRELLLATLEQRDDAAERRARVLNARLDVERAQVAAEAERLRSERLELANRELAHAATHDALTGLVNRRGFDAALAGRTTDPDAPATCVLADLDNFKAVNDRFSHAVGDEVLRQVARLVAGAVRGTDLVARIGGEEIAILLDTSESGRDVAAVCERVRTSIATHAWDEVAPGARVTISIGAVTRRPGEDPSALLARADALLYEAKSAGRDTVRIG
ncbi:diguanylate cyclase [Cellulomonas bogoriensis]|uniref:GGDEF domain-containing protein n=1 Tax=Cellulomonas bogoriensis 69B4 = DSM 16987 TaxID=1386082 RepID=A0A0A0BRS8_9CELL|nr:diguanylate cyclase [Cellulomonas bogoriensis]KGM09819.1 hypothetical protein N869_17120 [Cellulomonas bogoriensis 69B4 = DSM 16987]